MCVAVFCERKKEHLCIFLFPVFIKQNFKSKLLISAFDFMFATCHTSKQQKGIKEDLLNGA
jgi:hypothetical protein